MSTTGVMRRMRWAEMSAGDKGALLHRGLDEIFDPELRRSIAELIDDVRTDGDAAVCRALARFVASYPAAAALDLVLVDRNADALEEIRAAFNP